MSNDNTGLPNEQTEQSSQPTPETAQPTFDFVPEKVTPKVEVMDEVITDLTEQAARFVHGVGTTISQVLSLIDAMAQATPAGSVAEQAAYQQVVAGATNDTLFAHDDLQPTVDSPDADWRQYIEYNGQKLRMAKPPTVSSTSDVVSGNTASLLLEQVRGIGQTVTVPLPHTGIWLTIRSAKLSARIQLDTRLANEKSKLGRLSRGYVFSNDGVITNEILMDFIMSHVVDCTLQNWTPELLLSTIRIQDMQLLAHAMACTMYSKGFPYAQACTIDPTTCVHVTKAKLNLTKMYWTDNNKLTPFQKARMAARRERVPASVIDTYHQNWIEFKSGVIELPSMRLILQIPTIRQHLDSGQMWVNEVERMTEEALTNASPETVQDRMITQGMATRLATMAHWVKEIQMDIPTEDGVVTKRVEDAETIRSLLRDLSGEAEDRETIINGILKYINETTVSLVAIPNYPCGGCKKWQRTEEGPNKALIPFDAINTFFTLLQFKLMEDQDKNLI